MKLATLNPQLDNMESILSKDVSFRESPWFYFRQSSSAQAMPAFLIWLLDVNSDVSGTRTDTAASLSGGDDKRSSFKCAPASGNPWPEHRDFSPRSTVLLESIGILLTPVSKSATGSAGWIHGCFLSGKRCSHNIEECLKKWAFATNNMFISFSSGNFGRMTCTVSLRLGMDRTKSLHSPHKATLVSAMEHRCLINHVTKLDLIRHHPLMQVTWKLNSDRSISSWKRSLCI